jgi:putative acetyltransferase
MAATLDAFSLDTLDAYSDGAKRLLQMSDEYMGALYPAESNHLESSAALAQKEVLFIGGWHDGELIACGAVKLMRDDGEYGEIKRVFVLDRFRGRGLSRRIMDFLETHLRSQKIALARLETGIRQPEALGLYRKLGYIERPPFGKYKLDPLSVFMEKRV